MKRKAESDPPKEEQPKEKKQNALVKFKRPGAYFCVTRFSFVAAPYEPPEIIWRWLSHFGSDPGIVFGIGVQYLTAQRNNIPSSWVFKDEIEPVVFDVYFGGSLRGLARIIAEYAELDRESIAAVHLSSNIYPKHMAETRMRICGEGWPHPKNQWRAVLNAVQGHCSLGIGNICCVTNIPFTIPRPTTENVI